MISLTPFSIDIRDAFFNEVYLLGKKDKNLIFITDDLDSFGLRRFKKDFPNQFINIGVAEQNMIDVAAGLATCGKKVFVYGICSYVTARCFEQIKFSVCGMNLPVTIIGAGAGFSFNFDGPTHHGTTDVSIMRTLPEITILNPSDAASAARSAQIAYRQKHPFYIRLDKGCFPELYTSTDDFSHGFKILQSGKEMTMLSTGYMTHQVLHAFKKIKNAKKIGVIDVMRLKPLAPELARVLKQSKQLITVEENSIVGGLGTALIELLSDKGLLIPLKRLAVADRQFDQFGTRQWLQKMNGLDIDSIARTIQKLCIR